MKIKAISLWQPHATLFSLRLRHIETRGQYFSYRGPILICAAKECREAKRWYLESSYTHYLLGRYGFPHWRSLPYGQAVAVANMTGCRKAETFTPDETGGDIWGDFSHGRYGLIWENIRPIDPFPVKGKQGLFDVEVPDSLFK
jgi:hypothetical protein